MTVTPPRRQFEYQGGATSKTRSMAPRSASEPPPPVAGAWEMESGASNWQMEDGLSDWELEA